MRHLIISAGFAVVAAVTAAHVAVTNHDHRMDHRHWSHYGLTPINHECEPGEFVSSIQHPEVYCERPAQGGPTPIHVPPFCGPDEYLTVLHPGTLTCKELPVELVQ